MPEPKHSKWQKLQLARHIGVQALEEVCSCLSDIHSILKHVGTKGIATTRADMSVLVSSSVM